jgi:hypothetical protein
MDLGSDAESAPLATKRFWAQRPSDQHSLRDEHEELASQAEWLKEKYQRHNVVPTTLDSTPDTQLRVLDEPHAGDMNLWRVSVKVSGLISLCCST